jgi:hypothetical protein
LAGEPLGLGWMGPAERGDEVVPAADGGASVVPREAGLLPPAPRYVLPAGEYGAGKRTRGWERTDDPEDPADPAAAPPAPEGSTAGPAVGAELGELEDAPAEGCIRPV